MHKEYINNFHQIGNSILSKANLKFKIELIDGDGCGVTKIGIFKNEIKKYEVKYAYNHLDYMLGVCVYNVLNDNTNYDKVLLPKDHKQGLNTYGYSVDEIERLVKDILDLEKTISNKT